jgi:hypothetical protein
MPDPVVDVEGIQYEQIFRRLIADGGDDKTAITFATGQPPCSRRSRESGANGAHDQTLGPFVDYLVPNVTSAGDERSEGAPGLRDGPTATDRSPPTGRRRS